MAIALIKSSNLQAKLVYLKTQMHFPLLFTLHIKAIFNSIENDCICRQCQAFDQNSRQFSYFQCNMHKLRITLGHPDKNKCSLGLSIKNTNKLFFPRFYKRSITRLNCNLQASRKQNKGIPSERFY